eukprot:12993232-Ditylum_brightwellii.AAC.1
MGVQGLLQHSKQGKDVSDDEKYITVPLQGEFKGEQREHLHLLLIEATTASGFKPRVWLDQ